MLPVRQAFAAAVAVASELSADSIIWGMAEGMAADPLITLSQTHVKESTPWRETLSGTGADLDRALSKLVEITFQVRVETVNGTLLDDASDLAYDTLLGLRRLEALEALAGAALVTTTDVRPMHYRHDSRIVHAWSFDAILRAELTRSDPTAVGTIDNVAISGEALEPPSTIIPVETTAP